MHAVFDKRHSKCLLALLVNIREFKKLRRLLQRKRHIKIELCFLLSVLRLFHVCHAIRNRRSALLFAWLEWYLCQGREWKIYRCGLALSSEPQIWKIHGVLWQTTSKIAPKIVPHAQHDFIFHHSTNQIIDLWRCRGRCCRHFLNSLSLSLLVRNKGSERHKVSS